MDKKKERITDARFQPTEYCPSENAWRYGDCEEDEGRIDLSGLRIGEPRNKREMIATVSDAFIYSQLRDGKTPKKYTDLILHDPEYGKSNVIGYPIARVSDEDVLYGLSMAFPRFKNSGYKHLPSTSLEEDCSQNAWMLKIIKMKREAGKLSTFGEMRELVKRDRGIFEKRRLIKNGQNYAGFSPYMFGHLDLTDYVLRKVGFKIPKKDLKLFLYCVWS
jgi:hypothetical protein